MSFGGGPGSPTAGRLRDVSRRSFEILILSPGGGGGAASRSLGILIFNPGLDSFSRGMVIRMPSGSGAGSGFFSFSFSLSLSFLCFFLSSLDLSRSLCLCLSFFFFSFLCLWSDSSVGAGWGGWTGGGWTGCSTWGGGAGGGAGVSITGSFLTSMGDFFSVGTVIGTGLAKLSLSRLETRVGSVSIPFRGLGSGFLSGCLVFIALPRCDSLITFS